MARADPQATRPILVRKVRKSGHSRHHGGAWKVAYADFVTAMMAFFMLLWLVSNPDKIRLNGLAAYFSPTEPSSAPTAGEVTPWQSDRQGSGKEGVQSANSEAKSEPSVEAATSAMARGGSSEIPDAALRIQAEEMRLALESAPEARNAKNSIRIDPARDGVRIHLMDTSQRSMFKSGTADMNTYARVLLETMVRKLVKSHARIAIEGHTDSSGGQSDENWRLSGERAQAARRVLVGAGLSSDRIAEVVAMAGSQPIYLDQPDRPENRRVTIVILAERPALPSDTSFNY